MESNTNTKTSNGITFNYEEHSIETIDVTEEVHVFSNVTIVKSSNPKFKPGDKIEQISIRENIYFEHDDGTPY